jgi:hypothetical protein
MIRAVVRKVCWVCGRELWALPSRDPKAPVFDLMGCFTAYTRRFGLWKREGRPVLN